MLLKKHFPHWPQYKKKRVQLCSLVVGGGAPRSGRRAEELSDFLQCWSDHQFERYRVVFGVFRGDLFSAALFKRSEVDALLSHSVLSTFSSSLTSQKKDTLIKNDKNRKTNFLLLTMIFQTRLTQPEIFSWPRQSTSVQTLFLIYFTDSLGWFTYRCETMADTISWGLRTLTGDWLQCFCCRCATRPSPTEASLVPSRLQLYHRDTHVLLRISATAYRHVCRVQIQPRHGGAHTCR